MAIVRADVVKVIDLPADDDAALWIAMAASVASEYLTAALPAGRLDHIQIWLAAHFAAMKYERGSMTREKEGDAEQGYQVKHEDLQGLAETRFGRTAIALDSTGSLAGLATSPVKAQFRVI